MADIEAIRVQQDQFAALGYIYLQEFQPIRGSAPHKFAVACKPYKGIPFEYHLNILFEFSKLYPETPLKYELESVTGITRDSIMQIAKKLDALILIHESLSVFDIVQEARIWIHEHLVEGRHEEESEELGAKKTEVFQRLRFSAFTPVTPENFLAWKKEFDLKRKAKVVVKEGEVKPTGKQWFQGKHDEFQEDDEDDEDDEEAEEEAEGQGQGEDDYDQARLFEEK